MLLKAVFSQGLYLYAHSVQSIDLQVKVFDEINKTWGTHENIHEDTSFTIPLHPNSQCFFTDTLMYILHISCIPVIVLQQYLIWIPVTE